MNEQRRPALGGLALHCPGLTPVFGAEDRAEIADGPAAALVEEEDAVERRRLSGRLRLPGSAGVLGCENKRPGPPSDPGMLADAENRAEVNASVDVGRQLQVGETPGR